ncbi:MAG: hypothetical protein NTZ50_02555 [Chloroflexi bacterium]|nr:hypothetical protein [Chloroflexota bacterium]
MFARTRGAQFFVKLSSDDVPQCGLEDFLAMGAHAANESVASSLGWDTPRALEELMQPVLLLHSHAAGQR